MLQRTDEWQGKASTMSSITQSSSLTDPPENSVCHVDLPNLACHESFVLLFEDGRSRKKQPEKVPRYTAAVQDTLPPVPKKAVQSRTNTLQSQPNTLHSQPNTLHSQPNTMGSPQSTSSSSANESSPEQSQRYGNYAPVATQVAPPGYAMAGNYYQMPPMGADQYHGFTPNSSHGYAANTTVNGPSVVNESTPTMEPQQRIDTLLLQAQAEHQAKLAQKKRSKKDERCIRKAKKEMELATRGKSSVNPSASSLIFEVFKSKIWQKVKFIGSNQDEVNVTERVMKVFPDPDLQEDSPKGAALRSEWMTNYSGEVLKAVNTTRSYVQSRVREVVFSRLEEAKPLPNLMFLQMLMRREVDLNSPSQLEQAVWWWDVVMPRCTANQTHFSPKVRYFDIISRATSDNKTKKPDISASTEAFAAIVYQNSVQKWKRYYDLRKEHPGKSIEIKTKKNQAWCDEMNEITPKKWYVTVESFPDLLPKYTNPEAGQVARGGWNETGMKQHHEWKKQVEKARKTPDGIAMEERILAEMRRVNGINRGSYQDHLSAKKGNFGEDMANLEDQQTSYISDSDAEPEEVTAQAGV